MAYIGAQPKSVTYLVDTFSGNASQVDFTLRVEPVSKAALLVFVDGSRKTTNEYTVVGNTLTFNSAPSSGTDNIQVVFLGLYAAVNITTDASISTNKLVDGAVTTDKLANNSVTTAKIAPGTVIAADILDGTVDNNKLVSANITGSKLVANTITSREIADNAILANNIVNATITANKLAPGAAIANGQLSFVSSAIGLIPDSSSGISPYKILGQIQPTGNVLTTIYTVPASTNTMVTTITICNQSQNTVSVNIAANVSGSAVTTKNYIVTNYSLGGAETLVLEPRISLNVGSILSANITGANASVSNVSINAFGVEII